MVGWWQSRSRRERTLIAAMTGLTGLFVLWFLVISPLSGYRASGENALASARSTARLVDQASANAGSTQSGEGATGAALRGIITASAGAGNIPVSAFQLTQGGGSVVISVEDVPASTLYDWLGQLQRERDIHVVEARISRSRSDAALIQARLTLSQGSER